MEETTKAKIGIIVTDLAKKLKDNKSVQDLASDFTDATIRWFRSILLTDDGKPKEALADLQKNPNDVDNIRDVETKIVKGIKRNPDLENSLKAFYDEIVKKEGKQFGKNNVMNVIGDNNISFIDVKGNIKWNKK